MNTSYHHEQILNFAVKAGEIMLRSGAETYRVEDTITRILKASKCISVDTFVIPTGIIVTIEEAPCCAENLIFSEETQNLSHSTEGICSLSKDTSPLKASLRPSLCTKVCRVKNRSTRLDRVELINQLSRDYVLGSVSFEEAQKKLTEIEEMATYSPLTVALWMGITCSFFSVMFKGNLLDFILAFPIGFFISYLVDKLNKKRIVSYFVLFICSLLIGLSVIACYYIFNKTMHIEPIIIGCIMPLLPGVAFTNAVRDIIGDELLSGISRGVEALLMAVSIAAGIGISLNIGFRIGGLL